MTARLTEFIAIASLAFVLAWCLTHALRRAALKLRMLDVPNERSSHTTPTPRGGGVAIVVTTLLSALGLWHLGWVDARLAAGLGLGGMLVAALGLVDDWRGLSPSVRLAGHALAALGVGSLMQPWPALPLFGFQVDLGWVAWPLCVLYGVWSINLFNFMDGIDGLAGMEALTVALGGSLVWALQPDATDWPLALVFGAAAGGFLMLNFPPARIFMGDAGSGFLGFVIGTMTLWSATQQPALFWSWLILCGCFLVDATTTLVRRVGFGERFHVAHRNHAYQYAARLWGSHRRVTLSVMLINVGWLLPWALAVGLQRVDGALATLIAFLPLLLLALHFKAGDRKAQFSP